MEIKGFDELKTAQAAARTVIVQLEAAKGTINTLEQTIKFLEGYRKVLTERTKISEAVLNKADEERANSGVLNKLWCACAHEPTTTTKDN